MSKYKYSETERQINSVLKHQDEDLKSIHFPSLSEADALLRRLGYQPDAIKGLVPVQPRKTMVIPTWEQCCAEAEKHVGTDCELESLFTEEELRSNELAIKLMDMVKVKLWKKRYASSMNTMTGESLKPMVQFRLVHRPLICW